MQQHLPSATSHFSAQAKKGADHTNKLGQNDFFMDNPDYTLCTRHSFLSKPCQGNARGRPWQATVVQRRCVRLYSHRGANRARDLFAMAIQ